MTTSKRDWLSRSKPVVKINELVLSPGSRVDKQTSRRAPPVISQVRTSSTGQQVSWRGVPRPSCSSEYESSASWGSAWTPGCSDRGAGGGCHGNNTLLQTWSGRKSPLTPPHPPPCDRNLQRQVMTTRRSRPRYDEQEVKRRYLAWRRQLPVEVDYIEWQKAADSAKAVDKITPSNQRRAAQLRHRPLGGGGPPVPLPRDLDRQPGGCCSPRRNEIKPMLLQHLLKRRWDQLVSRLPQREAIAIALMLLPAKCQPPKQ
ncbi:unnamed protein product [Pleuronectes platessa]|uniref:Uncharacterized protein n=1 Tax=Pleuronectes platessa TaxID=8262 RepID=A0A9N7VIV2_PLEPL|nr:unnamed protein product [Pleuronectes platessa]